VAVLGDAAHAMPPNLGQGGGCAMMGALALAVALEEDVPVEQALANWESLQRPIIEHCQKWSYVYGWITMLPRALRNGALWVINNNRQLNRSYLRTANLSPVGTVARGGHAK
jgi:2-polyprenyl-6-methoxyphenol hydroxylase-like FAD-dependent oxidoreductase